MEFSLEHGSFKLNAGTFAMALKSVWNKYIGNCSGRWNGLYSAGYERKMEDPVQRGRNYLIAGLILDAALASPDSPFRVLDAGCGCGTLLPFINLPNIHYVGIDSSIRAIEQCRTRFSFDPVTNCRFEVADFETFRNQEKFDAIVFNEVLYYFKFNDLDRVFGNIKALSKDNDSLLLVSMSSNPKAFWIWQRLRRVATELSHLSVKATFWSSRWNVRSFRLNQAIPRTTRVLSKGASGMIPAPHFTKAIA